MIPHHSIDGVPAEEDRDDDPPDENTDDEGWSDGDCVEEWLEDEETGDDE